MVLTAYEDIRQSVKISVAAQPNQKEVLERIKNLFQKDINSARSYEQIENIDDLLSILEKRDLISEDNVSRLEDIATLLPNRDFITKKILNYRLNNNERKPNINQYVGGESWEVKNQSLNKSFQTNNSPMNSLSSRKIERINSAILDHIGTHWKDLGRNLMIQEGKMDEIESKCRTSVEKAIEILKEYEKKADPQKWVFVLCEALEKSRRKDISRNIMEIYTMNI